MTYSRQPYPKRDRESSGFDSKRSDDRGQSKDRWQREDKTYEQYEAFMQRGYFEGKKIFPELIKEWPKWLAENFLRARLTSTQLRRFFNKMRVIQQRIDATNDFERYKEDILGLTPLAAAAVGKETAPKIFYDVMRMNVDNAVNSQPAFERGFIIHFQSIIAYMKYYERFPWSMGK